MPLITITPLAYVDLLLAVDLCPVEVSGLGDVELRGREWRVTSIVAIPQKCSIMHTRFDPFAYNRYLAHLSKAGRLEEVDSKGLWWHSHVKDRARFSIMDWEYIELTFGRMVPRSAKNPWLVSIVANQFHELGVRLDIFHPRRETYENLPIRLTSFTPPEELRRLYHERRPQLEKIIQEMVVIDRRYRDSDDDEREGKL